MLATMPCPTCRDERPFEQPPCPDGHHDCPEWVCTDCGAALLVGGTWSAGGEEPDPGQHAEDPRELHAA